MAGKMSVLSALACVALLFIILSSGRPPSSNLALVLLSGLGLGLEVGAVRLRWFGFFSGAFAVYFAMALLPGVGPAAACVVALMGVGLRTLLRGLSEPDRWWREALADLLPDLAALAAVAVMTPPGKPAEPSLGAAALGLAVYLPLILKVQPALVAELPKVSPAAWQRLREMTGVQAVALAFMGPTLAFLAAVNPWNSLWLLPVLLGIHRAASTDLIRLEEMDRRDLERRERESRRALAEVSHSLQETKRDLELKVEEQTLLQELSGHLFRTQEVEAALKVVVQCIHRVVPCQSVVVFLAGADRLGPSVYQSPYGAQLEAGAFERVGEPVVLQAWQERRIAVRRKPAQEARVFQGEATCAALPLEADGVLYVGRVSPGGFTPEEGYMLTVVAGQATLGLQSARRFEAQQEALELHARANARLTVWVQRQAFLLEAARSLASSLSQEDLLDRLEEMLQVTMPGRTGAVLAANRPGDPVAVRRAWPPGWPEAALQRLVPLSEAVQERGHPLRVDDLRATEFAPPAEQLVSMLAVALFTGNEPTGAVLLFGREPGTFNPEQQDVLQLIAYQAAVVLHNARLYQEVLEAQAQLVQSAKMAAVGQLAAGVAHELNTPLGAILLQVESAMMRAETRPDLVKKKLEVAQGAALTAKEIISKLLFYSREGARGQREVELNRVVEDTLELIGGQLELDGVTLEQALSSDLPPVWANQNELQQVLTNLLLNARDAALSEGAASGVIALRTRREGEHLCLEVQDHGPGIPEEVQKRIFEPFFTTKPVGKGTGLGLSVSMQIAQSHGGALSVESAPGEGATFRLRLPVASAA